MLTRVVCISRHHDAQRNEKERANERLNIIFELVTISDIVMRCRFPGCWNLPLLGMTPNLVPHRKSEMELTWRPREEQQPSPDTHGTCCCRVYGVFTSERYSHPCEYGAQLSPSLSRFTHSLKTFSMKPQTIIYIYINLFVR